MLKARLDSSQLIPLPQVDPEELQAGLLSLKGDRWFQYLLRRLQRRYLDLALTRQSSEPAFDAGVIVGGSRMLDTIDTVFAEAARGKEE